MVKKIVDFSLSFFVLAYGIYSIYISLEFSNPGRFSIEEDGKVNVAFGVFAILWWLWNTKTIITDNNDKK